MDTMASKARQRMIENNYIREDNPFRADAGDGVWRTVNGTPVLIGKGGTFLSGPLKGKTYDPSRETRAEKASSGGGTEATGASGYSKPKVVKVRPMKKSDKFEERDGYDAPSGSVFKSGTTTEATDSPTSRWLIHTMPLQARRRSRFRPNAAQ